MIHSIYVAKCKQKYQPNVIAFDAVERDTTGLASIISGETWSPIVWQDGIRREANFLHASLIALDFDNGEMTLDDAYSWFMEHHVSFYLATTKSHQKEKISATGKIERACDRFRVIIATGSVCTDINTYKNTMEYFFTLLPCDRSCKDGARYFFPSKVISWYFNQPANWLPKSQKQIDLELAERELQKQSYDEAMRQGYKLPIPKYLLRIIEREHGAGERHRNCYLLGAELMKLGYPIDFIAEVALKNKSLAAIGEDDVRRAIRNGFDRASGEFGGGAGGDAPEA